MHLQKDEILYRCYLSGEEAVMRELMERYGDKLTIYINGFVKNPHDAEDLMIECFSYLVIKCPNIRDGGFRAYLYKKAKHYSLRFLQKQRRTSVFSLDSLESEPDSVELLDILVTTAERRKILYECMESLQPDYREALFLVYLEAMSYREAANIMGRTEKQIDKLLQSGKRHMRLALERVGITDAYNR